MKSILDRNFRYTSSVETDVRKTFARVRREMRRFEQAQSAASAEVSKQVLHIAARRSVPCTGAQAQHRERSHTPADCGPRVSGR